MNNSNKERTLGILTSLTRAAVCLIVAAVMILPPVAAYPEGRTKRPSETAQKKTTKGKKKTSSNNGSKGGSGKKKQRGTSKGKAETSDDVKRRETAARQDIRRTREQIKLNDAEISKGLGELGRLEGDINVSKQKVATSTRNVQNLQNRIGQLENTISAGEKELARMRAEYLKAVKKMRTKRREKSTLAFVFSAGSFNEAMRRMRYLKQFSAWRENQSKEIGARVESLRQQTDQLAEAKKLQDRELALQTESQRQLQAQYKKQDSIVAGLKQNGEALRAHLARKQSEANELRNRVSALIAEEQRKAEADRKAREKAEADRQAQLLAEKRAAERQAAALEADRKRQAEAREASERKQREAMIAQNKPAKTETKKPDKKNPDKEQPDKKQPDKKQPDKKQPDKKQPDKKADNDVSYAEVRQRRPKKESSNQSVPAAPKTNNGNFASMRGALPRPVSGPFRVTSRFGNQSLPDMPNVSYDNPGIDVEVSKGASVQSVYAGMVSGVYMLPGYGTVVIVNHDGYYTVYGNLSSAGVKVGDSVKQGQSLGNVAANADDPSHGQLHFEVWKNRDKLDPMAWIR